MKRIISLLLVVTVLFCSACGGSSEEIISAEDAQIVVPEKEVAEETNAETEALYALVDEPLFKEQTLVDVKYSVPDTWEISDVSTNSVDSYLYRPVGNKADSVMTVLLFADNEIYTMEQAEEYLDMFMDGFFGEQNGYGNTQYEEYVANVPARHGTTIHNGEMEVEVYCFLASTKNVFFVSWWHEIGTQGDLSVELAQIADTVQTDELDVFNNEYGTPTTKCKYMGIEKADYDTGYTFDTVYVSCEEYIAWSGDTQYCEEHSDTCLMCGMFIDRDSIMCRKCSHKVATSGSSGGSFTNKYGTSTTVCAKNGCNNYIASSGDTNCCITHSNKCLECGCYIDGDAMYCMSCLTSSVSGKSTGSSSGKTSKGGCQYKYSDGSVCGAKCTDHPSMCNTHFDSLNAIYQGLIGN